MPKRFDFQLTEEEYRAVLYALACQAGIFPYPAVEPSEFDYKALWQKLLKALEGQTFLHRVMERMKEW